MLSGYFFKPQYRVTGHAVAGEDKDRARKSAGADRAPQQARPGKKAGADHNDKAPLNRSDFSGLYDSGKRGGADRTAEPPGPAPENVYGSKEFYKWRAEDFKRRNPDKQPPGYYMNYGDKYARLFSDEVRKKLSPKGQKWVDQTRLLLQKKIEERMASGKMNELDPETFEDIAFEMHSDAYQEGGINNLSIDDFLTIGWSPEIKDLAQWKSIREGLEVLGPYAGSTIQNQAKSLAIKTDKALTEAKKRLYRNFTF